MPHQRSSSLNLPLPFLLKTKQNSNGSLVKLLHDTPSIKGEFVGPRATMITPWSTNAVEITQNMGVDGIVRIEEYFAAAMVDVIDPMLVVSFDGLDQNLFQVEIAPEKVMEIHDISAYNQQEGLALSQEEVDYLNTLQCLWIVP